MSSVWAKVIKGEISARQVSAKACTVTMPKFEDFLEAVTPNLAG